MTAGPRLVRDLVGGVARPAVLRVLRTMWRVAGVRPWEIVLPLVLALLVSLVEGASFALLIPLSDGVAAGSFAFLDGSPRFGWVTHLVPAGISSSRRDLALALVLLSLLLLGRLLKLALELVRGWWLTARDRRYFTAVGRETIRRVTGFGPLYFRRRPLGHIDAEMSWAASAMVALSNVEGLVMHALRLVVKVALVLAISTYLFFSLVVSLAVLAVLTHLVSRRAASLAAAAAATEKVARRETLDALGNMAMVKALEQESSVQELYGRRLDEAEGVRAGMRRVLFLKSGIVEATVLVGALVGEGMILVFVPGPPALHLARFCAFFLIAQQCLPDLQEISEYLIGLVNQVPRLEAVARLFDDEAKFPVPSGRRPFNGLRQGIEVRGLGFAYDPAAPVLRDLRATVPAGRVTALVGSSGSGKTTVAALLVRLYDCDPGTILFDGDDIRSFELGSLRHRVFLVGQDTWILDRSLRENLCFGLDVPPDDRTLWDALGDVGLAELVADLPAGLDTELGERGSALSGGERQRVALARVLLRDLDVLVLDEATAALDSALEERVMAAIRRRLGGRTIVVISHRFSTIRAADHVLVMDSGRIVEEGACEELIAARGDFARLFAGQLDRPAGVLE